MLQAEIDSGPVFNSPEKIGYGSSTALKMHKLFSIHTTLVEFEKRHHTESPVILDFLFFMENSVREIT